MEKLELSYIAGESVKRCFTLENNWAVCISYTYTHHPAHHFHFLTSITQGKPEYLSTWILVHECSRWLYSPWPERKQPKCSSADEWESKMGDSTWLNATWVEATPLRRVENQTQGSAHHVARLCESLKDTDLGSRGRQPPLNRLLVWRGGVGSGIDWEAQQGTFWDDGNVLCPGWGGGYTVIRSCQNSFSSTL